MKQAIKKVFAGLAISLLAPALFAAAASIPAVIPLPQKMELRPGVFKLAPGTIIYIDFTSGSTGKYLAGRLRPATGYPFKISHQFFTSSPVSGAILLTTKNARTNAGPEGYELTVTGNSVVIRAATQAGLFYGAQTLLQLLPPGIFSTNAATNAAWQLPCVQIVDWPRFKWRGLMLDVSRHFYKKAEVERILDLMALYKMNMFHWHLTDDQGWRIKIKKYPKLTQTGAWRKWSELEPPPPNTTNHHPAWAATPADAYGPDGRYGGFYTQDEIREVVAYAAARHITIVPEIEMPGHSVAALAAYPQFSCFGGPYHTDVDISLHDGIYDPADDGTFQFVDDVLAEVFKLFPGKYIHIGGDEVRKDYWAKSPECQALMRREGLRNAEELQSWFIRRIEKFVNAHGKILIGWSEILQGGLAPNAAVMDWIGGGKEAAAAGHDVVMTPESFCYFDHYYSLDRSTEPYAIGGCLPVSRVYAFNPMPTNLPVEFQSHVLGVQANLWTEYIASPQHLEYMIFPRLCALAEVVWSPRDSRDWEGFLFRLQAQYQRLDLLGINYYFPSAAASKRSP